MKAEHKETKNIRAIKTIPKSKITNWDRFTTEVKILQTLDHPHVIKMYEYFEEDKNVHLVTELCTGGELFDKIVKEEFFTEKNAARTFKQILSAINYCHTNGIVHRDLKPENFLLESSSSKADIKVIDFGLSKILVGGTTLQKMKTRAGTPYYISPEVLAGNYDLSCDMWSAGCILYILLCGYPPFYGDDNQEILQMVQKGFFDFEGEEWDEVSNDAKDLIKKLICKPERRLSAAEALKHRWIVNLNKSSASKEEKTIKKLNIGQMKRFTQAEKIKKVALMAIAVQSDPKEIQELKEIFKALDKDGNGSISFEELHVGLQDRENAEALVDILKGADTDGDGTINYTEFLAATMQAQTFMKESYLKQAFKLFDKDGSGKIDGEEVRQLLQGDEMKDHYTEE